MEANDQLGGALHLMKAIPGREHVMEAAAWWARQLDDLGVKVQLGVTATVESVLNEQPEVVVVATGAAFDRTGATGFVTSPIPGWDRDLVHTPEEVLAGGLAPVGKVVVLEEEAQAAVIAEVLAGRGAMVEVVSRQAAVALALNAGNQRAHQLRRLAAFEVRLTPDTWLREIGDHQVTLYHVHTGAVRVVDDVAAVVLVTARCSRDGLAGGLREHGADVRVIGDAAHPRRMSDATREGHRLGWEL